MFSAYRTDKSPSPPEAGSFTAFTELAVEHRGRPSLPQTARLMGEYPAEFFYLARIPVRVQRALGALIRAVAVPRGERRR